MPKHGRKVEDVSRRWVHRPGEPGEDLAIGPFWAGLFRKVSGHGVKCQGNAARATCAPVLSEQLDDHRKAAAGSNQCSTLTPGRLDMVILKKRGQKLTCALFIKWCQVYFSPVESG